MCYISDLRPGDWFLVENKRGIWMKTATEYTWIINERGLQAFDRDSDLHEHNINGYLCVEVDTGQPFVFTGSETAVSQL